MMCTLKYTCSLLLILWCLPFSIWAQDNAVSLDSTAPKTPAKTIANTSKVPVYQGSYLSLDIFNPVATLFNGGKFEASISADVSLWHRLFPVAEIGFMAINQQQDTYQYNSSGAFLKIGANYNFLNYKITRKYDHIFYAGLRYGYSFTGYGLTNAQLSDGYWQETGSYSDSYRYSHFGWMEVVIGVRVQIYKQFFMGLALQVKTFGHYYQNSSSYPAYIPGYGVDNEDTVFGFLYHLTYQIPYKK